jgi:putative transposase
MDPLTTDIKNELLEELLKKAGKPEDLLGPNGLLQQLKGALVQRMLEAEMSDHLGYEPHEAKGRGSGNSRNGHTTKTVETENGPVELHIPRDRNATFDPKVVRKHQRRLDGFDDKVLALYARGPCTRDIQGHLRELYGTDISADLISRVTDAVIDELRLWQMRPLDAVYPILYIDALFVSVREAGTVVKKAVYVALAVTMQGGREVLGLWIEQSEGARFWLSVLTDLKNRGLEDVFFICCDGLTGLPQAIEAVFPRAIVQTCIVHMIRASLRYVSFADRKALVQALRPIYSAENEPAARAALDGFDETWGKRYPAIVRLWRHRWAEVVPFLAYPVEIRRILYTTNAVESVNSQLRRVLKPKGSFPTDEAVLKMLYLALQHAKNSWKASKHWAQSLSYFSIMFGDRFPA